MCTISLSCCSTSRYISTGSSYDMFRIVICDTFHACSNNPGRHSFPDAPRCGIKSSRFSLRRFFFRFDLLMDHNQKSGISVILSPTAVTMYVHVTSRGGHRPLYGMPAGYIRPLTAVWLLYVAREVAYIYQVATRFFCQKRCGKATNLAIDNPYKQHNKHGSKRLKQNTPAFPKR